MEAVVTLSKVDEVVSEEFGAEEVLRELTALELALIGGGTVSGTYL
jgi:hypothetical protein